MRTVLSGQYVLSTLRYLIMDDHTNTVKMGDSGFRACLGHAVLFQHMAAATWSADLPA